MASDPFAIDWSDEKAVCAYADELGPDNLVVKYPDRTNYNITPSSRQKDLPDGVELIYWTEGTVCPLETLH